MPFFADSDEVYHYLGGIFRIARDHPEVGAKLRAAELVVRYNFHDPEAAITVTLVESGVEVFEGTPSPTPDLTLTMSADDGDKFWRGKLNAPLALARGVISVEGPAHKLLKLVPAAKAIYPLYTDLIAEKDAMRS